MQLYNKMWVTFNFYSLEILEQSTSSAPARVFETFLPSGSTHQQTSPFLEHCRATYIPLSSLHCGTYPLPSFSDTINNSAIIRCCKQSAKFQTKFILWLNKKLFVKSLKSYFIFKKSDSLLLSFFWRLISYHFFSKTKRKYKNLARCKNFNLYILSLINT